MIGESLEAHCSNEFNRVRTTMYPNAYFEKDNDASGGSKGDFIFRDSIDGVEYISIMFEMKNEMDTTATKHKNEDFLCLKSKYPYLKIKVKRKILLISQGWVRLFKDFACDLILKF